MNATVEKATIETGPLVSVIMPVYNAGAYLREAVQSVLAQTYPNWELILIDDGSTDGCVESIADLQDPRIHRHRQANAGKPATMNRGIAMARGEFYALLDADDRSHPERLERQVACLVAHAGVAGVFSGHEIILDGTAMAPTSRAKSIEECAREIDEGRMPGHDPTAMYRLSMVREIPYCETLYVGEGTDYIFRIGERFPLMVVGACLYQYRIHWQSLTRRDPALRDRLAQVASDRMRERRGLPKRHEAPRSADNDLVEHFMTSVADQVLGGRRLSALRTGLQCLWLKPGARHAKPLVYAAVPRSLMSLYRRTKGAIAQRRLRGARAGAKPSGAKTS